MFLNCLTQLSSKEGEEEDGDPSSRKKIRKIKSDKKLGDTTKAAARAEEERRKRIAEKQEKVSLCEADTFGGRFWKRGRRAWLKTIFFMELLMYTLQHFSMWG